MKHYQHILVLVNDEQDGPLLLHRANQMVHQDARITLAHIMIDYRAMNYISDSMMNDAGSNQVIEIKALLNHLAASSPYPVTTRVIISLDKVRALATFIRKQEVDLVIIGHHNRLFGVLTSRSMAFINHLDVDCFICHIPPG